MRSSCPVCRGGSSRLLEPAEPPHRVLHCPACDVAFVDPFPDRAALQRRYGPGYYAAWISRQKSRRARMWDARLRFLEGVAGRGRLLDVGCGDGAFLEQARRRGWEVAGTEISSWAAAHAAATLGRAVFCGELREAAYPEAHFDAVTLWHVLEHVTEPLSLLEEVRRILKPRGVLIVAVPNRNDRVMQAAYRLVKRRRPKLFSLRDREPHLTFSIFRPQASPGLSPSPGSPSPGSDPIPASSSPPSGSSTGPRWSCRGSSIGSGGTRSS